jgi:DNA mismatch repair ATPase MutS
MSGKTTFLRTVGVTTVMAQTIATCLADGYAAPRFVVRSVIGRADDLLSGKSYYAMEVEAVLALVRAGRTGVPHLLLFDEMFRGTNAVERIAAGEAVLASLVAAPGTPPRPHVAIAATHDRELVDLLRARYAPCHFTDSVGPDGLVFDFKIHPGPATSRNAIALLRLAGAPDELVAQALARAAELDSVRRRDSPG